MRSALNDGPLDIAIQPDYFVHSYRYLLCTQTKCKLITKLNAPPLYETGCINGVLTLVTMKTGRSDKQTVCDTGDHRLLVE